MNLIEKHNKELNKAIMDINSRYKECFMDILTDHMRREALRNLTESHYQECFVATAQCSINPVLYGLGDILNKVSELDIFDKDKSYMIGDNNGEN